MASSPLIYSPRFSSINTRPILRSFASLSSSSSSFVFSLLAASNAVAIRSSTTHSGFGTCRHRSKRAFRVSAFQRTRPVQRFDKVDEGEMTIKPAVRISDRKLIVKDQTIV
ncbi:uncharacterized protein LOC120291061 isoform X1 [Eucalyptus grandis]|uniref:uncharacterized protein LOC120291061 isoform X1 n=1 Tax=Eucalyptus grandis TaxID=71139 RepID=UPI00192E78A4|nr:uncharacterized protein LOC120291061 isoform X1 [Eucalyptus grandis]